jgi:hypothetical protein
MRLNTWEFGNIRIVDFKEIATFDRYIRDDDLGEWSYYQLADNDGEIVAVHNWED